MTDRRSVGTNISRRIERLSGRPAGPRIADVVPARLESRDAAFSFGLMNWSSSDVTVLCSAIPLAAGVTTAGSAYTSPLR